MTKMNKLDDINNLSTEEFKTWIRSRLKGSDSYFPIDSFHGDSPHTLFADLYEGEDLNLKNKIRDSAMSLLSEASPFKKDEAEYLNYLLRLTSWVEPEKSCLKEGVIASIKEAINQRVFSDTSNYNDTHASLLVILQYSKTKCGVDFWLREMENPSFAVLAFNGVMGEGISAIMPDGLKKLLEIHNKYPNKVSLYIALRNLYKNPDLENVGNSLIQYKCSFNHKDWGKIVSASKSIGYDIDADRKG